LLPKYSGSLPASHLILQPTLGIWSSVIAVAQALLQAGADTQRTSLDNFTALDVAATYEYLAVLQRSNVWSL